MAVVKLLPHLVEREYVVGIVEGNHPLVVLLFPYSSVGVNDAFTEVGAQDLNELCCFLGMDIGCSSPSFNESINPLHRVAVVTEPRV